MSAFSLVHKTPSKLNTVLLLLFITFPATYPFLKAVNEIKDLETDNNRIINDAKGWTNSGLLSGVTSMVSQCGQNYLLGGYSVLDLRADRMTYFQRVYDDLPAHSVIFVSFEFWILDSWDAPDKAMIMFDSVLMQMPYQGGLAALIDYCGMSLKDVGKIRINGAILHTASSLTLKIIGYLDQDSTDESFGIRNLNLLFKLGSTAPITSNLLCGKGNVPLRVGECTCMEGLYQNGASCLDCHPSCLGCFGPNNQDCFQCSPGYYFDGARCSSCGSSCISCDEKGTITDIDNICKECRALFVNYIKPTYLGHQYTMILSPYTCDLSEPTVQQYLRAAPYPQESFQPFGLEVSKIGKSLYQIEITLKESLPQPTNLNLTLKFLEGVLPVPRIFIPSLTLQQAEKFIYNSKTALQIIAGTSFIGTASLDKLYLIWTLITLQQFISYLIYINVEYPFQVKLFFSLLQEFDWSVLPNPFSSLTESISKEILDPDSDLASKYQPPKRFDDDDKTSFFIQNAGSIVVINAVLLVILLIVTLLMKIEWFGKSTILKGIKTRLKWNIIIRTFFGNGMPLMIAINLQLRATGLSHPYLIVCFVLALISLIYIIWITFLSFYLVIKNSPVQLKKPKVQEIYGTLYEGMDLTKPAGKYYYLLLLFRGYLLGFVIVFIERIPILQIYPLMCFNVVFIRFLFIRASFKSRAVGIINKIKEIFIFLGELCIFGLMVEINSIIYYEIFGWGVVGFLGIAIIVELVYLVVIQIIEIKTMIMKIVSVCKHIKSWCFKPTSTTTRSNNRNARTRIRRPIDSPYNDEDGRS